MHSTEACPRCTYQNRGDAPFCGLCGLPFKAAAAPPPPSPDAPAPAPATPQTPMSDTRDIRPYLVCPPYPPIRAKKEAPNRIGRDPDNDLVLPHKTVSRFHANLLWTGQGFLLRDLGSRNGILVNDLRVQETEIRSGDLVRIGPFAIQFVEADARSIFHPLREAEALKGQETEVLEAPRPSASLSGNLQQITLPALLQALDSESRTGVLRLSLQSRIERAGQTLVLRPKSSEGTISLEAGRIVDARVGALAGGEALYTLLQTARGEFRFDVGAAPPGRTVEVRVQEALLEHLRRLDEQHRAGARVA